MKNVRRMWILLFSLGVVAAGAIGCAAESDDEEESTDTDEGALDGGADGGKCSSTFGKRCATNADCCKAACVYVRGRGKFCSY